MNKASSTNCNFSVSNFEEMKQKVLCWANQFSTFCFLDNHRYQTSPHTIECLLAAGVKKQLKVDTGNALDQLQEFINSQTDRDVQTGTLLFGHLGYDLKNETENLSSEHPDHIGFPDLYFFEPEIIIRLNEKEMMIESDNPEEVAEEINAQENPDEVNANRLANVQSRFSKDEYLNVVRQLQQHIHRGDCYEINFCQEFFAENTVIDPLAVYKKLSHISPNPFSALYRINDKWLICASPERFLQKKGDKILSQPIKGTSGRIKGDAVKDNQSKKDLLHSQKDRSENVMVVDLVRNDLARVCREGTVKVEELFGIYSFPQVHQMISTVSGTLKKEIEFTDIIRATFPMGSMTGAPKKRVMELIEQYEKTKRGIFSGALGYISPENNFDFNVVIRSIMYNATTHYLSYQAGSGITFYSEPEKEWEECLLKAEAIKKVLAADQ